MSADLAAMALLSEAGMEEVRVVLVRKCEEVLWREREVSFLFLFFGFGLLVLWEVLWDSLLDSFVDSFQFLYFLGVR